MFVRLRDFKRLIKEAYTGAGLYVAHRGNQLLFGGSGIFPGTGNISRRLGNPFFLSGSLV